MEKKRKSAYVTERDLIEKVQVAHPEFNAEVFQSWKKRFGFPRGRRSASADGQSKNEAYHHEAVYFAIDSILKKKKQGKGLDEAIGDVDVILEDALRKCLSRNTKNEISNYFLYKDVISSDRKQIHLAADKLAEMSPAGNSEKILKYVRALREEIEHNHTQLQKYKKFVPPVLAIFNSTTEFILFADSWGRSRGNKKIIRLVNLFKKRRMIV
jgi:hypothetical protein